MSYSAGMLKDRVQVWNRLPSIDGDFGRVSGNYTSVGTIWASVTWKKGKKAMDEGALEAYDYVMVRCRYNQTLTRESRLVFEGTTYQIESFHADRQANIIQITAVELPSE